MEIHYSAADQYGSMYDQMMVGHLTFPSFVNSQLVNDNYKIRTAKEVMYIDISESSFADKMIT